MKSSSLLKSRWKLNWVSVLCFGSVLFSESRYRPAGVVDGLFDFGLDMFDFCGDIVVYIYMHSNWLALANKDICLI